jgi:hypothetical protein
VAKKEETKFQEKVLKRLRRMPKSWWLNCEMLSLIGIPDIIGCVEGRFVALELKRNISEIENENKHLLQRHILMSIENAGGYAMMVSPEVFDEVCEEVVQFGKGMQ